MHTSLAQVDTMTGESLQGKYDAAKAMQQSQPAEAISELRDIVLGQHPNDAETIKVQMP